jgi:hypothetical protein
MANLFGKSWTRAELLRLTGDIRQIAEVRLCELSDGPSPSSLCRAGILS